MSFLQAAQRPEVHSSVPVIDVLGVRVSAINLKTAVDLSEYAIRAGRRNYICVTGVHGVMEAHRDPQFCRILNNAILNVPDGMPLSWIGWLEGMKSMNRVYGPEFMLAVCQRSVEQGFKHFLLGGKPGVAQMLKSALEDQFPGLRVTGTFTPPFRPLDSEEEQDLLGVIRNAAPDVIWVGLSTPKQERFMARYSPVFDVPLMVGVGAAFDIHTGLTRDAPVWIKRAGMQWLHRISQEPRRLAPRYLENNPQFVWKMGLQLTKRALRRLYTEQNELG